MLAYKVQVQHFDIAGSDLGASAASKAAVPVTPVNGEHVTHKMTTPTYGVLNM